MNIIPLNLPCSIFKCPKESSWLVLGIPCFKPLTMYDSDPTDPLNGQSHYNRHTPKLSSDETIRAIYWIYPYLAVFHREF